MTTAHQIDQAIGAHGLWKSKLRAAIESGALDGDFEELRATDRCVFGQWMHGPNVSETARGSAHWVTVDKMHERFHSAAAKVAELAVTGRAAEARGAMERTGEFGIASTELVTAMLRWKQAIDASASAVAPPRSQAR